MRNLFYFSPEKCLCWVAGYSAQDHSANVSEMTESIRKNAEEFAGVAGVALEEVKSEYVTHSSRYKGMRIFYAVVDEPPASAFVVDTMTMRKYICDTESYHQPELPGKFKEEISRPLKVWARGIK